MLGVLHRTALGKGPDNFQQFFKVCDAERHCTRSGSARHNKQLVDIKDRHFLEIERRSALGLILVYNRLLAETARFETVKDFQRSLQQLLENALYPDAKIGELHIAHVCMRTPIHYDKMRIALCTYSIVIAALHGVA